MPLLDVSEVLTDPMFQTTFSVIRTTRGVSGTGRTTLSAVQTDGVVGVITGNNDTKLNREAEGSRITSTITVHTQFALTDGDGATDADVVLYQGRQYVVTALGDYSDYGAGFIAAVCSLIQPTPTSA